MDGPMETPSRQEAVPGPAKPKRTSKERLSKERELTAKRNVERLQQGYDLAYERFLEADKKQTDEPSKEHAAALRKARREAEEFRIQLEKAGVKLEQAEFESDVDFLESGIATTPTAKEIEALHAPEITVEEEMPKEVEIDVSEFRTPELGEEHVTEISPEGLADMDRRVASLELEIDDLQKAGKKTEVAKKARELASLNKERRELESELHKEQEERMTKAAEEEVAFAEVSPVAGVSEAAREVSQLKTEQDKLAREIKRLSGHEADEILITPSLTGSFGQRVGRFFNRMGYALAGRSDEYKDVDTLMKQWRSLGSKIEEKSRFIDTEGASMAAHRAEERKVGRAAARGVETKGMRASETAVMNAIASSTEELDRLKIKLESTKEAGERFEEAEEVNAALARIEKTLNAANAKAEDIENDQMLSRLANVYAEYADVKDRYSALHEELLTQSRTAKRGGRRIKITEGIAVPGGTMGTAEASRRRRVQLYEGEGASKEFQSAEDYRETNKQAIKVAMKEYPDASAVWDKVSGRVAELDPASLDALQEMYQTQDVATAYTLDAAFANTAKNDLENTSRLQRANQLLGWDDRENLATPLVTLKKPKAMNGLKKGGTKKTKAA